MVFVVVFCCVSCSRFKVTDEMEAFRTKITNLGSVTGAEYSFNGHPHSSYGKIYLVISVDRQVDSIDDPLVLQVFNILLESDNLIKDIDDQGPVWCSITFRYEDTSENMLGFTTKEPGGFNYETWYAPNLDIVTLTTDGITVTNTKDEVEFYSFVE